MFLRFFFFQFFAACLSRIRVSHVLTADRPSNFLSPLNAPISVSWHMSSASARRPEQIVDVSVHQYAKRLTIPLGCRARQLHIALLQSEVSCDNRAF
jgi:hypothetical protein